MMKLYSVTLTAEVVVVAENFEEAERFAEDGIDMNAVAPLSASANLGALVLPDGWDEWSIPFGKGDPLNPDKTIGEWQEEAADALLRSLDSEGTT